jgi:hypothetical protein
VVPLGAVGFTLREQYGAELFERSMATVVRRVEERRPAAGPQGMPMMPPARRACRRRACRRSRMPQEPPRQQCGDPAGRSCSDRNMLPARGYNHGPAHCAGPTHSRRYHEANENTRCAAAVALLPAPCRRPAQQPAPQAERIGHIVAVVGDSAVLNFDLQNAVLARQAAGQRIPEPARSVTG